MKKTILEMKNVTKCFPGVIALKDISIDLKENEILAICGENGAGKSTLMKVLSGSYTNKDYTGEIHVNGKQVLFQGIRDSEACGIEMVYQELNMIMESSLSENLYVGNLPGKYGFVDHKTLYHNTKEVLLEIGLDVDPNENAGSLGSGQLQMLSIMRAMQKNPKILVLDEPTSALDEDEVTKLFEFLDAHRKKGLSCIFITHKLDEVFRIADRVAVMRDGEMVFVRNREDVTKDELIEAMVGRKIEDMYVKGDAKIGEEVLRVEHLCIPHPTIKNRNIVDNVSFSVNKGEIFGIGGLVGSGRTETLSAIFGYLTHNVRKEVYVKGEKIEITCPLQAIKAGIGYVTEERKRSGYVGVFSIRENLTLNSLPLLPGKFFIDKREEKKHALSIFERMRVKASSIESNILQLSGGNQQKVVLGKTLLAKPEVLLIDEPTKGIDVGAKTEIYKLMRELVRDGATIIMVSSDMPELVSMSDRCIVLSNGKVTGEFRKPDITQDNVMRAAIM